MQRLLLLLSLLALGACNSSEPKGNMTAEQVADELAQMKIRPGRWVATNEILSAKAPGMPAEALKAMIGQKTSVENCITPEQAAKPNANFLAAQKDSDCTYQDWSMDEGKMRGTMTCQGGGVAGKVVMKMDGDYGEEGYAMTMEMETTGLPGGMSMNVTARTVGKRVGECA